MKSMQSLITIVLVSMLAYSCSKWDDFKKYVSDGEILYTGKMDSVKVYSGKERVMLTGLLKSDPKLDKIVVSWDNGADSVIFDYVKQNPGIDSFSRIFPVGEGVKSFRIITYDAAGNKSVDVNAVGVSYGANFRKRMSDRPIVSVSYSTAGTTINWDQMDLGAGPQYTEIKYNDGEQDRTIITPINDGVTVIEGVSVPPPIEYRTVFLPDETAIDTFATAFTPHNVIADVTQFYLSNYGPDFQGTLGGDNRFGNLGAPWITNAGARNKGGGSYGGYQHAAWQPAGVITWETWGDTPVTDGKVYQVSAKPLPAGNYTVSFNYYSEIQQNSSVYCIAAAGDAGIPSLDDISNSLGYMALFNGSNIGATSPNINETRSFSFTLDSPQYISLGFLGNIVGSGNPGSYFEVKYIQLIQN
ncbi:DUF4998 domain-containing protein [Niabella terrae]